VFPPVSVHVFLSTNVCRCTLSVHVFLSTNVCRCACFDHYQYMCVFPPCSISTCVCVAISTLAGWGVLVITIPPRRGGQFTPHI
jgi:hypothetical protein